MNPTTNPGPPVGAARHDHRASTAPAALAAMAAAGHCEGVNAAAWWQQDTIGGRATADPATTARRTLAGLDDIDPRVIDALPHPDLDEAHLRDLHEEHADPDAPAWDDLDPTGRDLARETYLDAFHTAVHDAVAGHCQDLLEAAISDPTAAGTR